MSLLSSLMGSSAITGTMAQAVTNDGTYQQNRERLAVMVQMGYAYMDWYAQYRSTFFALSLVATAGSAALALKKRTNPEAVTLYSILALASAGVAYFTRPDFMRPTPVVDNGPPQPSSSAIPGALAWLDNKGAELSQVQPGWEAANLLRLANDFGAGTLDPAVQTMLTSNTH